MTPHIKANKEDIADVVLMPGDPLRAKMIAEKYLTDAKLVNDVSRIKG
jgi:purine-nucleoside phosphorylase